MKKPWFWFAVALCPLALCGDHVLRSAPEPQPVPHRSPVDLVLLPGGRLALAANHTADSVSLIDLAAGKVLAEQSCGRKPAAVACSRDGRRAAVSNLWSGTVSLLDVQDSSLRPVATVPVGSQPRGLVFAADGDSFFIAVSGADEVVQLQWPTGKQIRRWPAPSAPRRLALSRDGRLLAAVCDRSAQLRCWDTRDGKQLWERTILEAFNLHALTFTPGDKDLLTAHLHHRHGAITEHNIGQGWSLDNRLSRVPVEPDRRTDYYQIALDTRGKAVGDPSAAAFTPKGDLLAVAAGGTHELLLFQTSAVIWNSGDPGDFIELGLDREDGKYRRITLGGRPMAVQFSEDGKQAIVANYLLDALQVVDVQTGKLSRTIALGAPEKPSLARRGEAIFYDAQRSHHQWFSCHTCHPDGHTTSKTFDTLNDDSYGNPKLTPTLRGVAHTGPWTWHGWQDDLGKAVEKSLTDTLFGPKPTADDVKAVVAFLGTLEHPPNPHRRRDGSLTEAAERGKAIFNGKARCVRCHQGENYTSTKTYDVGLESDGSPFEEWNPPSLRGVWERGPYLHDGRADSLEEVLKMPHAPQKLGGKELTPEERRDLIEFLKSL